MYKPFEEAQLRISNMQRPLTFMDGQQPNLAKEKHFLMEEVFSFGSRSISDKK